MPDPLSATSLAPGAAGWCPPGVEVGPWNPELPLKSTEDSSIEGRLKYEGSALTENACKNGSELIDCLLSGLKVTGRKSSLGKVTGGRRTAGVPLVVELEDVGF